jgi:parvulin-like peptidyl-prolyl isomerase
MALLNLDCASSSFEPVIDRLHRFELYPQLIHEILTDNLVEQIAIAKSIDLDYPSTEYTQKYTELEQSIAYQGMNESQLGAIADRELKLQQFKLALWGSEIESYFNAQGGGLDRVVLSILQVADASLAQELFFRIQSGEESFAEIALDYSQGIHAQNGGILGPLLLRELTPGIRQIVERLVPGELSILLRIDDYYTFFRLDEREPAQLDERMYQFLLDEQFSTWLESQLSMQLADLPLTKRQVLPERLLDYLSRSKLLVKYLRSTIIEETLAVWESSPAFGSIRTGLNIESNNCQADLLELYKQIEFDRLVKSRFLACKLQLDRLLFSAIQVKNLHLAQELYCQVRTQNKSLTRLATKYSDSPAAKRGGVIGPVCTLQLHPAIQQHLMGLEPKQVSLIFQLDEHYIFLRLDRLLPVQLNPQIERQLRDELFDEWLQQQILSRIGKTH